MTNRTRITSSHNKRQEIEGMTLFQTAIKLSMPRKVLNKRTVYSTSGNRWQQNKISKIYHKKINCKMAFLWTLTETHFNKVAKTIRMITQKMLFML